MVLYPRRDALHLAAASSAGLWAAACTAYRARRRAGPSPGSTVEWFQRHHFELGPDHAAEFETPA